MTKEQAIELIKEYKVAKVEFPNAKQEQALDMAIKSLEQPTTQEILSYIETGITATGQSDSYCVGFCNALAWLKSCITHEEPQFFEDSKVSEISTSSTTSDDVMAIFIPKD